MKFLDLLAKGNSKLDKSILGWSITPIVSCLNCSQCAKDCYAAFPYRFYPNVKKAWDRNFELAKTGKFANHVINQLNNAKNVSAVRIHVSGDFFCQEYINQWEMIIAMFPEYKFYTYTKVMHMLDFSRINQLANFNLISSITADGGINFGDTDRVKELVEQGYKLCPATVKGNEIVCGGAKRNSCTICQNYDKVCFIKHK